MYASTNIRTNRLLLAFITLLLLAMMHSFAFVYLVILCCS